MPIQHQLTHLSRNVYRKRFMLAMAERWRRRAMFVLGGVAVGATAVALAVLADKAQLKFTQFAAVWWMPVVLTPLGFGLCAYIATRWFRGSQGSGIPQTIAAHRSANPQTRNHLVSLRVACGKIVLTVLGLLCGASMGREGPTVQIGAAIMFSVGKLSPRTQPGLIVAGCAAGVAAAFNAPLAGIMFAIEEMSRSFERHTSGLIIAAVIAAGLMAMWLLGNYTYFGSTSGSIARSDWLAVVICGIFGGLAGGIFSRILIAASSAAWRQRFRLNSMRGAVCFAMVCGLAVVLCGALSDNAIYGTGYAQVRQALVGSQPLHWYFMPLKFCATIFSSISGIPGGIFSPSLAIGAGLGSEIAPWFPGSSVGLLMLLGMVGYLAGVVQAPMTAFVIVTEMTDDHAMLMPLMAAALLAHASSRLVCREGLYHALAKGFLEPRATRTLHS